MAFGAGASSIARNSSKAGSERTVAAAFLPGFGPFFTGIFPVFSAMSGLLPFVLLKRPSESEAPPAGPAGRGR